MTDNILTRDYPPNPSAFNRWNAFLQEYEWSTRTGNVLNNYGIDSVDKLLALTKDDVKSMPNAGNKTWAEVEYAQWFYAAQQTLPEGDGVKLLRAFEKAVRDDEMAGSMDPDDAEIARYEFAELERKILTFMREVDLAKADLHTRTAMKLFNCGANEVTPNMRELAKQYNYLRAYTPLL